MTAPDEMTLVISLQAKDGPDPADALAGVRGVAVADAIRRVGAKSQLAHEASALFPPVPSA